MTEPQEDLRKFAIKEIEQAVGLAMEFHTGLHEYLSKFPYEEKRRYAYYIMHALISRNFLDMIDEKVDLSAERYFVWLLENSSRYMKFDRKDNFFYINADLAITEFLSEKESK